MQHGLEDGGRCTTIRTKRIRSSQDSMDAAFGIPQKHDAMRHTSAASRRFQRMVAPPYIIETDTEI
eukprot:7511787-Pyramimonas_sp.AAC.1